MKVEVNGVRLFFDVEGASLTPDGPVMRERPALVMLHGGPGMDGSYFRPWASPLAELCQVVYVDQRGCGRSDRGEPSSWTLAQWGDDVRAFCDALGIKRPIVCGSSFGGEVAMSYATRHPEHLAKLILLSCAPRLNVDRIAAAFTRLGGAKAGDVARRFWTNFDMSIGAEYVRHCTPLYFRTPQDPHLEARAVTSAEVTLDYLRPGGTAQNIAFAAALAGVRCPTLVMGGADDPVTTIEDMEDIARAIPQHLVTFERIESCGHGPFFDAPERTLDAIRAFISAA